MKFKLLQLFVHFKAYTYLRGDCIRLRPKLGECYDETKNLFRTKTECLEGNSNHCKNGCKFTRRLLGLIDKLVSNQWSISPRF